MLQKTLERMANATQSRLIFEDLLFTAPQIDPKLQHPICRIRF